MKAPEDIVTVEALDGGNRSVFDRFASISLRNSMMSPSEASFEVGDDGTFVALLDMLALGKQFRVYVNNKPRLQGRIEMRDSAADPSRSSNVRFVVRTKLTDAFVASANPKIQVKNRTIKDFVLDCYATIGVNEDQFVFRADVGRDLMTGKKTKGGATPPDLTAIQETQAKINPPETVFAAVDRHLRRHGFMHWDAPDGRIIVGTPDDSQNPAYRFVERISGSTAQNNITSSREVQDIAQTPLIMTIFGQGGGGKDKRVKVSATEVNQAVLAGEFQRPVIMVDESIKTKELAEKRVRREMANRSRSLRAFDLTMDGLAYNGRGGRTPYAPDTVAELMLERLGGELGAFYVESTDMQVSDGGSATSMRCVPRGIWVL